MAGVVGKARVLLKKKGVPVGKQVEAVKMLDHISDDRVFYDLLDQSRAVEVQQAALAKISDFAKPESAKELIARLPGLSPSIRTEVMEVLLGRNAWIETLLIAIDGGEVSAHQIAPTRQKWLLKHANPPIQKLARKVFENKETHRAKVVQKYQAALKIAGDDKRGLEVFRKNCLSCHRHGKEGFEIGPDVSTVRNRDSGSVLIQILDPNREVLTNFVQYFVTLKNGKMLTGRIVSESSSGLTLRRAGGIENKILRKNIKSIMSSGQSLMPEGLEAVIDLQSMSDLLAFLKS